MRNVRKVLTHYFEEMSLLELSLQLIYVVCFCYLYQNL